uniref:Uncharacterized protein n=1 Tax=Parascaris equorum TaxID=6256 RepID=A0A914RJC5_PAREQ
MDHEVDVFHAVKMIRINRPQLIDMKVFLQLYSLKFEIFFLLFL